MKKIFFYIVPFLFIALFMSCDFFSKPVYKVSRDVSGVIGSMSTGDIVGDMDKFASDPSKTADVLNELGGRNQKDIQALSREDKEKLLESGVGAIIPTSKVGELVDTLTSDGGSSDFNKIVENLCEGSPTVNTKALETALSDEDVLTNTDAETLALSAASLIVATVKNESGESSVDSKMEDFKAAASGATKDGVFDEGKFKEELQKNGFGSASIDSLTVAMNTTKVLQGTAGAGKPNRKSDVENLDLGGQNIGDLLDKMTGEKS